MIHEAARSSVQSARSTTIAGSETAVTMSSRPDRNAPVPTMASSTIVRPRPIASECRSRIVGPNGATGLAPVLQHRAVTRIDPSRRRLGLALIAFGVAGLVLIGAAA